MGILDPDLIRFKTGSVTGYPYSVSESLHKYSLFRATFIRRIRSGSDYQIGAIELNSISRNICEIQILAGDFMEAEATINKGRKFALEKGELLIYFKTFLGIDM